MNKPTLKEWMDWAESNNMTNDFSFELKTAEVDGKCIEYTNKSIFEVQVGKGKGAYKTRYTFEGRLDQACFYYRSINIGLGYKKRLVCKSLNKPVIAKATT
jgi:L-rhamnose isomerase